MNFIRGNFVLQFKKYRSLHRRMSSDGKCGSTTGMKLVWIDMEMSGLKIEHDKVLEVACLLSDIHLKNIVEGPNVVLSQPDSILNTMDTWCTEHHTKTGLAEECKRSKITENDAENILLDFLTKHIPKKEGIIAGNSVYTDRLFLRKYFPKVDDYLHYRLVDVSSIKELCSGWYPDAYSNAPKKANTHRALDDIKESIEELRYYKNTIFRSVIESGII